MTVTGDALQFRYTTKKWGPLATVSLAILMTDLDSVMLPVATISITRDLQAPVSGIQAAFTLFSLTAASMYLTGGKLGDIHGRKRIYRTGLILYGLGVLGSLSLALPWPARMRPSVPLRCWRLVG